MLTGNPLAVRLNISCALMMKGVGSALMVGKEANPKNQMICQPVNGYSAEVQLAWLPASHSAQIHETTAFLRSLTPGRALPGFRVSSS